MEGKEFLILKLKFFFAVLTVLLVIYLVVRGLHSKIDWERLASRKGVDESDPEGQLLNIHVMTLGIVLIGGFYFLDLSYWIISFLQTLFRGKTHVSEYFSVLTGMFCVLIVVVLVLMAPFVARLLGNYRTGWPRDNKTFRQFVVAVLLSFSAWVLITKLPAVIVGSVGFYGAIQNIISDWMSRGYQPGIFKHVGFSEIQFLWGFVTTILAIFIVGYRNLLSGLLTDWYGVIARDE